MAVVDILTVNRRGFQTSSFSSRGTQKESSGEDDCGGGLTPIMISWSRRHCEVELWQRIVAIKFPWDLIIVAGDPVVQGDEKSVKH